MNMQAQICEAVCKGFRVREVPIGYAIAAPVEWINGDKIRFFARIEGERGRLEDDGSTVFELEGSGIEVLSGNRRVLLGQLLDEHSVEFDEEESLFRTPWVAASEVAKLVPQFSAFMTRVQDLSFLSRDRVESTFKEDLASALRASAGRGVEVLLNVPPVPSLPVYLADIVIKSQSGKTVAIFPVTSDVSVLRAVLFSKEVELNHVPDVVSFLVYETVDRGRISSQNQAIAANSELIPAVWQASKSEVVEKVLRRVS
jgi:hypothetical protein